MDSSTTKTLITGLIGGIIGATLFNKLTNRTNVQKVVTTKASPAGGHYSQAVIANGFVTISGLLPITSAGVKLADKTFAEQVNCVLDNLDAILTSAGSSKSQLVNCRVYVSNIDHWGEFNKIYSEYLGDHKPSRCVVPVPVLHYGTLLELEAVAVV
jgi:2-iminobutanoate/2-iminopropanoate deaminase